MEHGSPENWYMLVDFCEGRHHSQMKLPRVKMGPSTSSTGAVSVRWSMNLQLNLMIFQFLLMNNCPTAFVGRVLNFNILMPVYVMFYCMLFYFLNVFRYGVDVYRKYVH
ncbi:hypothetical protein OIU79_030244 [Salix purpurea]|uniref:Transmembrane protein n=1 Tax=Salix purpurea TaxID=77065 RepID=A0A9Q0NX32_SALPP|nr:hypothetical protein OIU79_030244 [Salix purpurea]